MCGYRLDKWTLCPSCGLCIRADCACFFDRFPVSLTYAISLREDCGYCEKGERAGAYLSGSPIVLFYILWHFRAAIVEGLLGLRLDWLDCVVFMEQVFLDLYASTTRE